MNKIFVILLSIIILYPLAVLGVEQDESMNHSKFYELVFINFSSVKKLPIIICKYGEETTGKCYGTIIHNEPQPKTFSEWKTRFDVGLTNAVKIHIKLGKYFIFTPYGKYVIILTVDKLKNNKFYEFFYDKDENNNEWKV